MQYFAKAQQRMAEDLCCGSDCATDPVLQPVSVLHQQRGTLYWPQDSECTVHGEAKNRTGSISKSRQYILYLDKYL